MGFTRLGFRGLLTGLGSVASWTFCLESCRVKRLRLSGGEVSELLVRRVLEVQKNLTSTLTIWFEGPY